MVYKYVEHVPHTPIIGEYTQWAHTECSKKISQSTFLIYDNVTKLFLNKNANHATKFKHFFKVRLELDKHSNFSIPIAHPITVNKEKATRNHGNPMKR